MIIDHGNSVNIHVIESNDFNLKFKWL